MEKEHYFDWAATSPADEDILKEWRKRSYSIGKIVEVREPFNTYYDAYVLGIGKEGALVVEKIDGTLVKVISGECIIKK